MMTTTCLDCGTRLGESYAEYEDGCICLDCDRKYDTHFGEQETIVRCTVCRDNFVDAGTSIDTCDDCLNRQ